jgi:hypothetical protein
MKPEKSPEDQIRDAIKDVELAMLENIEASKSEVDAKIRKEKARYNLLKSQERLNDLYRSLM